MSTPEAPSVPIQPVENPIINKPYEEPTAYWKYDEASGAAQKLPGRRPAQYWYRNPSSALGNTQQALFRQESADDLVLVNLLRDDVRRWRDSGYENATSTTKTLLRYWRRDERQRKFFFCQLEAVETIIYLREILDTGRSRAGKPSLSVEDYRALIAGESPSFVKQLTRAGQTNPPTLKDGDLLRLGAKMATGSGKTLVMALIITWAFCNRAKNPLEERFPKAALVLCPNLTVKERLQVLRPEDSKNYYDAFDLVPLNLRPLMQQGRVLVQNWHQMAEEGSNVEDGKSYRVVNKGEEGDEAYARRVLGDLYGCGQLMVLNDEAHHAYRPKPLEQEELDAESKADREEATVWVEGMDRLNQAVGVRFCVDVSATPFYLSGSGYVEGSPFPWLVSDFGLTDAIESGIVKIPRLPVSDTTGRPEPKFYRLWDEIKKRLQKSDYAGKKPKPESIYREAEEALLTLASQWKERFTYTQEASPDQETIPPVLIVVCDNTQLAQLFHERISGELPGDVEADDDQDEDTPKRRRGKGKPKAVYGESKVFSELANFEQRLYTLRIDSKLLDEAEKGSGKSQVEDLRNTIATVGRRGERGENVRCVVSVQMLTEGWDANNVTHILGLRAFGSQLLCEQVVGRGLRRMNYDPDPDTGLLPPEYVDVYGIPFSIIPFKGRETKQEAPEDKPLTLVRSLPEREHLRIEFPVVEGYTFALKKNLIKADVSKMHPLKLDPTETPTAVMVKPQVADAPMHTVVGFDTEMQNREAYYASTHLQAIEFELARVIVSKLTDAQEGSNLKLRYASRAQLFPQVLRLVRAYIATRIQFQGINPRELGLDRYANLIVERFLSAIEPNVQEGELPLLPILNRYIPIASTDRVRFQTTKPTTPTTLSPISHMVGDTKTWEQQAAFSLEQCPDLIESYVKNNHLNFTIAYVYKGSDLDYMPDFLIRMKQPGRKTLTIILEIKGYIDEQDHAKHDAAQRWVSAVNNWGRMGTWAFVLCRNPVTLRSNLEKELDTLQEGNAQHFAAD